MPDTIERIREREAALHQLSDVFTARDRAFSIHYSLQRLRQSRNEPSPPVAAVALRNFSTGTLSVFSIKAEADRAGIPLSQQTSASELLRLEYALLFRLQDFFAAHTDALFVHWYMRDARYGFEALEHRFRAVSSQLLASLYGERHPAPAAAFGASGHKPLTLRVPDNRRVDLAQILNHLYGIGRVRLRPLAEANGLSMAELIDGKDEPMAFAEGNHARLAWSSATKARLIAELAEHASRGTIAAPQLASPGLAKPLRVFISYRRQDTQAEANWLHEILSEQFGDENVFIDTDDIPIGSNFDDVLRNAIASCDVFLAMIGPEWAKARDENGFLRLADALDYVRLEIRAALERDVLLAPVLIEGTRMPTELELPADLMPLRHRQAATLRIRQFRQDAERLIAALREAKRAAGAAQRATVPRSAQRSA